MKRAFVAVFMMLLFVSPSASEGNMQETIANIDDVFRSGDYDKALEDYQGLLAEAVQQNDTSVQVELLSQIARCHLIRHRKEEAKQWLTKAEALASSQQPLGWSRYLGVRGRVEWKDSDNPRAAETFKEMFDYCTQHDLASRAIDAVHMVAIVGTHDEQIEWSLKGISLAEEKDKSSWLGPLWNNLAITYSDIKNWDKCVEAFEKARHYHWLHGSEMNKLYADYHIGWALRMKGDHDKALTWLRPVLSWAERLESNSVIGQSCQDMGEIAIARGDKESGLTLLHRALECYEKEGYPNFAKDIYEKLKARIAELAD